MHSKANNKMPMFTAEKGFLFFFFLGVSSQGSQAWRWENKSQIHLPKGKGLGIFIGEEYRVRGTGQVTGSRKKEIEFLFL